MIEFNSSQLVINDYAVWQENEILAGLGSKAEFVSGNPVRIGHLCIYTKCLCYSKEYLREKNVQICKLANVKM